MTTTALGGEDLTQLDLMILESLEKKLDLPTVAKAANMSKAALGIKIAKLQLGGYIGEDGVLTDKGKNALTSSTRSG